MQKMLRQNKDSRFNLCVIEPTHGKPGRILNTLTVWSDTLMNAIKQVKADGADGCVIVSSHSYHESVKDYNKKHAPKEAVA
jgi:hypothetical protein